MLSFKELIRDVIEIYNRYRRPFITAKFVEVRENILTLDFEGTFCRSCGVYDYFEDFIYELVDQADVDLEILSYEPRGLESFRVKYLVKEESLSKD